MNNIDNILESYVKNNTVPGFSYSIISNDNFYCGNVGYKQTVPANIPNSLDTLYDIASLSKVVVTVTLISKLVDKMIISLSDKLIDFLPDFKYPDITIYDLLTHTSGLPADFKSKDIIPRDEVIKKMYACDKEYETGSNVVYSDIGYMFLGLLIEKIYGKSLDIIAKEEIFTPLEMNSTCYNPTNKDNCAGTEVTVERGLIKGVVHDEKCFSLGGVAGHAGVFTTCNDLSNFMSMILNDGIFNGKRFLSKDIINLWFKPLIDDKANDRFRSLCWIVGSNVNVIMKNGNIISFSGFTGPCILIDKDTDTGICLLTNRIHPSRNNPSYVDARPEIISSIYKELGIDKVKRG